MPIRVPVERFITPDPIFADESASVDELWRLMDQNDVRHLPIVRGDDVVGLVSDRDVRLIMGLSSAEKLQVRAGDVMSPDPVTVPIGMPLDEVAYLMADRKLGSVLVQDEGGTLVGIFTATDALNTLAEIVRRGGVL